MNKLLDYINGLGAFETNLIASAVFLCSTFLVRYLFKKATVKSKVLLELYEKHYFYKFVAHKSIYELTDVPDQVRFFFQVCLYSISWITFSCLIIIFFLGVNALVAREWFLVLGFWLSFNAMLEAYMWARDSRGDKTAQKILEEKNAKNQKQAART